MPRKQYYFKNSMICFPPEGHSLLARNILSLSKHATFYLYSLIQILLSTPTAVVTVVPVRCSAAFVLVCPFFHAISKKTNATRITKLDTDMVSHDHESWKSIYFGIKGSKVKVTRHKGSAGVRVVASI